MCLVWSAVFLAEVITLGSVGLPMLAEGGSQVVISWCTQPTSVGKSKKHVRVNGGCVLVSIWGVTERHLRMAGFESS